MQAIPLKAHVKADGILDLRLSTGLPESDVDVVVVLEPANGSARSEAAAPGWPKGFFDRIYGSLANETLENWESNP
ncbi:MAG: hypothetical protein AAB215_01495 [Planctomycetota bacterium]